MPLDVCGAMSQGLIGYFVEQVLSEALGARGCQKPVVAMITRTLVGRLDPAFQHPTKPIGPFYDASTAERLRDERGWVLVSDSGRGYRRVVPSPAPLSILGTDAVNPLLNSGAIVVTGGGGGIPVVSDLLGAYRGVEAVVDKDLAACLLARQLGARTLVLLTDVPEVCISYGTPQQQSLGEVCIEDVERLDAEGHFPPGSMGPKIRGALGFLRSGGKLAVITSPEKLGASLLGGAGTRIHARS
jgi:carbamate kinase